MYAVIRTGGKQTRVEQGQRVDVELLGKAEGDEVDFTPVLVVDGDTVVATASDLGSAKVTARVVGETKGPKIRGFTYKNKTNQRRRWGHRQRYSTIEITGISRSEHRSAAEERSDQKTARAGSSQPAPEETAR
jgi:large subunit ribosomal protein L21